MAVVDVTIRGARVDELADVGRVTVDAYAADGYVTADDPYAALLADAAGRDRDAELWVAVGEDDRLLGTVTYVRPGSSLSEIAGPDEAEIRMLAVIPQARGRGLGERLTRACVDRARDDGYAELVLSSATWMHAAHRVYERMGFERVPDRDWSPRDGISLVAYRLSLRP
jgi:ribosomal protein S18 acetylase RimI-like enzyme